MKMGMGRVFLTALILAVALTPLSVRAEQEFLKGTLVDQKGNVTKITRIVASGYIKGRYQGKDVEITFPHLKRLENLGNGFWRVTNTKGKQFNVENAEVYTHNKRIYYRYFSEIEMKEARQAISYADVRILSFDSELGRLKFNPRTGQYFPPDYIYDPFTGEELTWKNPGR